MINMSINFGGNRLEIVNTIRDNIDEETGFWNFSYPPARRGILKKITPTLSRLPAYQASP